MKISKTIFLFLLLSLSPEFLASVAVAQITDERLTDIENDIRELLEIYNGVGVSVAIVENDSIIYTQGFGMRDRKQNLKMNAETSLPIASVTKSFSATLLGMLNAESKISIKDKPSLYITDLTFFNDKMNNSITIEDLLSHRSGLGSLDGSSIFFPTKNDSEFIGRFKYLKPNGETKNSFLYSNVGYGLLGHITEIVTQKTWANNLQERIFKPLEMSSTVSSIDALKLCSNVSKGYGTAGNKQLAVPYHKFTFTRADGAICSSAKDMGNWLIAWLDSGRFKNKQVIPAEHVVAATTIHNILPQNGANKDIYLMGYGFGWFTQSYKGQYNIRHSGGTSGFTSHVSMYPYKKIGIVVLSNQHGSALPIIIEQMISDRMLKLDRKVIADYPVHLQNIYQLTTAEGKANSKEYNKKYCGNFENEGYGTINIQAEDGILYANFPTYRFRLEMVEEHTYIMEATTENSQYFNPNFTIEFSGDKVQKIKNFAINFQNEPVIFTKK